MLKESADLPYLYWTAGSSTCSTKELSIHLTKILSAEGQQKYCETVYSRSGINHMWILKNFKDLLDNQVDDPAVYLSLYGVLWSLGIQYK
jgi:hypothetical protein